MMKHQIDDYIVNFLAGTESPGDAQKLKEWLDADPAHRDELRQWLRIWDASEMVDDIGQYAPEKAYNQFMSRIKREISSKSIPKESRTEIIFRTVRRIAAVFVISFALGMLTHYYMAKPQPEETAYVENIVPLGSKSEIKLPDGSMVWLNAGSKLRYPTDYGKTNRDIFLEGEGYFKVAKHAGKPFTVHTALLDVKALGTEFNVKAYPEEGIVETTLITGKVSIDKIEKESATDPPVVLVPGQKYSMTVRPELTPEEILTPDAKATLAIAKPTIKQLAPTVANAEVSWKERNWRIESEELQSLSVKIERRYNVHIQVDDKLKNYRFSGTIKDESLEQVLNAMQLTAPILFRVDGKNVYLRVDPKKMKIE